MSEEKFIMLIDDDIDDRSLFSRAAKLERPELICVTVDGGQEAFAMLNRMTRLPQVIFLDLNMPGMSGWDFLAQFKKNERFKNIPILIYSTSSHEKDIIAAQIAGATGYCVKPMGFDALQTIISFVCAHLGPGLSKAIENNKEIPYFKSLIDLQ